MLVNNEIKKEAIVVNDKVFASSDLLARLIDESDSCQYFIDKSDATVCVLRLFCKREGDWGLQEFGSVKITIEDVIESGCAKSIGWQKYPEKMLFAKAIVIATRKYFPELLESFALVLPLTQDDLPIKKEEWEKDWESSGIF